MSNASSWFPCYVNDLLGSIRWKTMTPTQRGAYWQLICWQMQSDDGHLPADVATLSVLADLSLTDGNGCIVDAFPVQENGKRANVRALKEWYKRAAISSIRSEAGSKGIAKRWQANSNCLASATTTTTTTTTKATTRTKKEKRLVSAPEWLKIKEGFTDELWEAWLLVRKSKKATATEKAIALTCERMNEKPDRAIEALKAMVERNWISFKWDWIDRDKNLQPLRNTRIDVNPANPKLDW